MAPRTTPRTTLRAAGQTTTRAAGVVSEFFSGFATLFRGFGWWKRRPGLMLLGLLPALIVAAGLIALVLVIATNAEAIVAFVTPFADSWDPGLAKLFRVLAALSLLIGFVVLAAFGFTALTLLIGDWFYERIWRAVETDLGGMPPAHEPGFWRAVADGLRLVVRAIVTSVLLALLSLIPVVGTILAAVLGLFFSARILAIELTTRPLEARGMNRGERLAALRTRSPRVVGFGVAVQLCFLVPGGAILVMPAAVAGATHLARHLLSGVDAEVFAEEPPR
ncbi:MAG: EI24 domain-containing protein [Pseudolysinimonas sp.]